MSISKSHCGASKPAVKIRDKTAVVWAGDNKGMASPGFFLMMYMKALC